MTVARRPFANRPDEATPLMSLLDSRAVHNTNHLKTHVLAAALALLAWFGHWTSARAESRYIHLEPSNKTVVVFVHGILGDAVTTWTAKNGAYWPRLLKEDKDFAGTNIYVYQYPSVARGTNLTPDEVADDLRKLLVADRVIDHDKVIFLSHSMGGILFARSCLSIASSRPRPRLRISLQLLQRVHQQRRCCGYLQITPRRAQFSP